MVHKKRNKNKKYGINGTSSDTLPRKGEKWRTAICSYWRNSKELLPGNCRGRTDGRTQLFGGNHFVWRGIKTVDVLNVHKRWEFLASRKSFTVSPVRQVRSRKKSINSLGRIQETDTSITPFNFRMHDLPNLQAKHSCTGIFASAAEFYPDFRHHGSNF